ncbi:MAG: hypothetical protein V3R77_03560, partial [Candidatus Binatia bacterium]
TCDAGADCQAGTPPCEDTVACTIDGCDEDADACASAPSDAACDDGSFCSGAETCDAETGCQDGADVDCSGIDSQCAIGTCDDSIEGCDIAPINEGQTCDDGLNCTFDDICSNGDCLGLPTCDSVCERCDGETGECVPMCAVPVSVANFVVASDALFILRAAVAINECALCVCDLNSSGEITATDAVLGLRAAVGLDADINCPMPATGSSTTSTTITNTTSTTLLLP